MYTHEINLLQNCIKRSVRALQEKYKRPTLILIFKNKLVI